MPRNSVRYVCLFALIFSTGLSADLPVKSDFAEASPSAPFSSGQIQLASEGIRTLIPKEFIPVASSKQYSTNAGGGTASFVRPSDAIAEVLNAGIRFLQLKRPVPVIPNPLPEVKPETESPNWTLPDIEPDTGKPLSDASSQLSITELRALLDATIAERDAAKQSGITMENANSALKLENDFLARSNREEGYKRRHLQGLLSDAKDLLKQNGINSSQDTVNQTSAANSWDLKETVYDGDKWHRNWDGRQPPWGPENVTATRMIYFIRHGHYEWSKPEDGIGMSELGAKQMEAVGKALAQLKIPWNKNFVHSSKHRTQEAAQMVVKYLPGNLTLVPSDIIWSCANDKESERRQRAFKAFIYRASPEQNDTSHELIMSHSSIVKYFVERAIQVARYTISLPLVHGSITRLEIPPDGRVVLREFGEYSYMPKNLLSRSNAKLKLLLDTSLSPGNTTQKQIITPGA